MYNERVSELRHPPRSHDLENGTDLDRTDVRGRRRRPDRTEGTDERGFGALVVKNDPGLGQAGQGARLPERATGDRGQPPFVRRASPVVDEVHESPVGALLVEEEVQEPGGPAPQRRVAGRRPQVCEEDDPASGVVDAGHAFLAALAGRDELVVRVGVDRERERRWPGGRNRAGEPVQLPQHGRSEARISFTEKSAAAVTESAAP